MILTNYLLVRIKVDRIRRDATQDWRHIPEPEPALTLAGRLSVGRARINMGRNVRGRPKSHQHRVHRFTDCCRVERPLIVAIYSNVSRNDRCSVK